MMQRQSGVFRAAAAGLLTLALAAGRPLPARAVASDDDTAATAASPEVADVLLGLKVRAALLAKLGRDGLRIEVEAADGQLVLSGVVTKRATAALAQQVAKAVSGVQIVDNQIDLAPAPAERGKTAGGRMQAQLADAILEIRVKSRLVEEFGKAAFALEVEAADGAVSLSGELADPAQHDAAIRIARKVPGVTRIVDLVESAAALLQSPVFPRAKR
jgi:osmotically-inducible protein OsmY